MADPLDPIEVVVEIDGDEILTGTMRTYGRSAVGQAFIFQYDQGYLSDRRAYPLDPALPLTLGVFQPPAGHELFGAFSDGAPDRWGRRLMTRAERGRAAEGGRRPRSLGPVDYLLGVRDLLRQGAIRYRRPDGEYVASEDGGAPALVDLPRLLAAADVLEDGEVPDRDLKDLFRAGGSLGGARPKAAVVLRDGALGLAKFPDKRNDDWDIALWERVEAILAERAGITVAESTLEKVMDRHVLILRRFDRAGDRRIGFASAMTLLEASDGDTRSYLEIASAIELHSKTVAHDLEELFRRVVFSLLTTNTDDHLRNHAFLRVNDAWQLSPAYDLNPNPEAGDRTTALDPDGLDASVEATCSVADIFRLSAARAKEIVGEVETATRDWRQVARQLGARRPEIDRMELAYETEARTEALHLVSGTP